MNTTFLRSILLATIALPAFPLAAQTAPDSEEQEAGSSGNTIIVTAQKIEQRAQDVPITISAVSGNRIKELGVTDLDELSSYVPGLLIQ